MNQRGKLIQVFLKYNDPNRLTITEIKNWTGQALMVSRGDLTDLLKRKEAKGVGVYLLLGEEDGTLNIYVGETENFRERIKGHFAKEFWNKVILFVNKDSNLTKAHVQYLEQMLYKKLVDSSDVTLTNSNVPNKGILPEAEEETMGEFLDNLYLVLGVLGYSNLSSQEISKKPKFFARKVSDPNIKGEMIIKGEQYVVLKGSQFQNDTKQIREQKLPVTYYKRIEDLINKGIIVDKGDYYQLTKDISFSSPSTAALFVLGRRSNGRTEWKTKDGLTFAEFEEKLAGVDPKV